MTTPQTFHASVSPKILDKVTRLFNASPTDIFSELIQNARRAGATRIDVYPIGGEESPAIVFRDESRPSQPGRSPDLVSNADDAFARSPSPPAISAGMGFPHPTSRLKSPHRNAEPNQWPDLNAFHPPVHEAELVFQLEQSLTDRSKRVRQKRHPSAGL